MEQFINKCVELCTNAGGKIIIALALLIVGRMFIKGVQRLIEKAENFTKQDKTVQSFVKSFISFSLNTLLVVSIVAVLGVPMASVTAVIASCGLAIGLSLQGALSNFAGGIMILIFKPFSIGDYIESSGAEGIVKDISIFYTVLTTLDNKRITVPNGDLMNSNITNFSCEQSRRVDLDFKITNDCDQNFAKAVLLQAAESTAGVKNEPAPFARLTAVDDDTLIFSVRAWCESSSYWDVYFDLIENCSKALADNGIDDPEERIAIRMVKED